MKNPLEQLRAAFGMRDIKFDEIKLGRSRADRHRDIDVKALRKRRAKNRVARRQRRINRKRAAR